MPDTPRTVGDAYNKGIDADSARGSAVYVFLRDYGDALIGCQGRVVYTAEDVEVVRAALAPFIYGKEFADLEFLDSDSVGENKLLPMARAAITAAGGVVAEEVVVPQFPRDILYIVRAKEE